MSDDLLDALNEDESLQALAEAVRGRLRSGESRHEVWIELEKLLDEDFVVVDEVMDRLQQGEYG